MNIDSPFEQWRLKYMKGTAASSEIMELLALAFEGGRVAEQSKYSDIVSDGGLDPRNKFDAQPEQTVVSFPSFMRKRIEQALKDAIHPTGMSFHDGKVKVLVSDLSRMLLVVDSVLAQPEQTMTPISSDQYERFCRTCGACTGKPWVGLTDDEIEDTWGNTPMMLNARDGGARRVFARAIEEALRKKNERN